MRRLKTIFSVFLLIFYFNSNGQPFINQAILKFDNSGLIVETVKDTNRTFQQYTCDIGIIHGYQKKIEHTFKFKNEGNIPLIITNAYCNYGGWVYYSPSNPIRPGSSDSVKVIFPITDVNFNKIGKTCTIKSNAYSSPDVIFIKWATSDKIPANTKVYIESTEFDFGEFEDTSKTQFSTIEATFVVHNVGLKPLYLMDIFTSEIESKENTHGGGYDFIQGIKPNKSAVLTIHRQSMMNRKAVEEKYIIHDKFYLKFNTANSPVPVTVKGILKAHNKKIK